MAAVAVGDRYRNVSGAVQFGQIPAGAVAEVRQVDPKNKDTAHYGTLVLEWDPDDDSGIKVSAGLVEADLNGTWELVKS